MLPPPLKPQPRTQRTRRSLQRQHAAAEWLLQRMTDCLNGLLAVSCRFTLWFSQAQQIATERAYDIQKPDGRWVFVCPWCGSETAEHEVLLLTCCQVSARDEATRRPLFLKRWERSGSERRATADRRR